MRAEIVASCGWGFSLGTNEGLLWFPVSTVLWVLYQPQALISPEMFKRVSILVLVTSL